MQEVKLIDANKFKRMLQNLRRHLIHFGAPGKAAFISHIIKWLDRQPGIPGERDVNKLANLLRDLETYSYCTSFENQAQFLIDNGVVLVEKKEN